MWVERPSNLLARATEALGEGYHPNSFGYDKRHPRLIACSNPYATGAQLDDFGHKRKSLAYYEEFNRGIQYYLNHPTDFPELGFTPVKHHVKKHDAYKEQKRFSLREKIGNFALYLIHHSEILTGRVGVRRHGKDKRMRLFDRAHAAKVTGMSADTIRKVAKIMDDLGMLERTRRFVKKEDGSYGSRVALYQVTEKFWQYFQLEEAYKEQKAYYLERLEKFAKGNLDLVKSWLTIQPLERTISDLARKKSPNKQNAAKGDFEPSEAAYYLQRLPKHKHETFTRRFNELLLEQVMQGNSDLSTTDKTALYQAAFKFV